MILTTLPSRTVTRELVETMFAVIVLFKLFAYAVTALFAVTAALFAAVRFALSNAISLSCVAALLISVLSVVAWLAALL